MKSKDGMTIETRRLLAATAALLLSAGACGAPAPKSGPGVAATGTVRAALVETPAGVKCIRITATAGEDARVHDFPVEAGSSSELEVRGLPEGWVTLSAEAFQKACGNATGEPDWITPEPVDLFVQPGRMLRAELYLRPNYGVAVAADFEQPVVDIACGKDFVTAILADGSMWGWGNNSSGQLGGDPGGDRLNPEPIPGVSGAVQVTAGGAHACALTEAGAILCWGSNSRGQLGDGTRQSSPVPREVGAIDSVAQITAGDAHTCAVTRSGEAHCWGYNLDGQLGIGTWGGGTDSSVPRSLGSSWRFAELQAGDRHTCGVTTTGDVRCWGYDVYYRTAEAGATNSPGPVRFTEHTVRLSEGSTRASSCATRSDGRALCWGHNSSGQLATGGTDDAPSVVIPDEWSRQASDQLVFGAAHGCGLDRGSVSCAGANYTGQLGTGSASNIVTGARPVNIDDVTQLCAGQSFTCALKGDGAVWCWGYNDSGQLGDGTVISRFTPVKVVRRVQPPAPAVPTEILDETAFSADAARVTFDDRATGELVTTQYQVQGVTFDDTESAPVTLDPGLVLDASTHSAPLALANGDPKLSSGGIPLVLRFDPPMTRVGLYAGGGSLASGTTAVLTAFDAEGTILFEVGRDALGLDVQTFLGIDAGAPAIAAVHLDYGSASEREIIDDLLFE